jgi:hypothetical protein
VLTSPSNPLIPPSPSFLAQRLSAGKPCWRSAYFQESQAKKTDHQKWPYEVGHRSGTCVTSEIWSLTNLIGGGGMTSLMITDNEINSFGKFLSVINWNKYVKKWSGGWRDGSVFKSTDCSSKGPEFNSQQPHGGSQPSVMGSGALFWCVWREQWWYIYIQK